MVGRCCGLILGAFLATAAAATSATVETKLEKAKAAFAKEKYGRALDLFAEADRLSDGRSVIALLGASSAATRAGKYARGEEFARRALVVTRGTTDEAIAHQLLGLALMRGDRSTTEAEAELRTSLATAPHSCRNSHFYLAELYGRMGAPQRGLDELERFTAAGGDRSLAEEMAASLRLDLTSRADFEQCEAELRAKGWSIPRVGHDPALTKTNFQEPRRIHTPVPEYPPDALRLGIQGSVVFESILSTTGAVQCLTVVQGLPMGLTEAATRAAIRWRFEPALLDGEPIPVRYRLEFSIKR